jgi:hypothetical protein
MRGVESGSLSRNPPTRAGSSGFRFALRTSHSKYKNTVSVSIPHFTELGMKVVLVDLTPHTKLVKRLHYHHRGIFKDSVRTAKKTQHSTIT